MAHKRSPAGFLFWLGLVTAVLLVFVFSRPTIERVLDSTNFFAEVKPKNSTPVVVRRPSGKTPNGYMSQQQVSSNPDKADESTISQETESRTTALNPNAVSETPGPPVVTNVTSQIFFVTVSSDGAILLQGVQRTVSADISPLTLILRELLAGPTDAEQRENLITLLPKGVELNQTSIRDRTAFIDLGQAFRFSSHGREGLLARLQQLVYSATELPNVDAVQVLIDGNNVDYLGPEGIYIREPLTRQSFER